MGVLCTGNTSTTALFVRCVTMQAGALNMPLGLALQLGPQTLPYAHHVRTMDS